MILAVRLVAAVLAAVWAVPLFGVVDLVTALSWREGWEESLVLEASWGSLFTFFMAMPLLALVVRPERYLGAGLWSGVTATALVGGAIIVAEPVVLWLALAAAVTGAIVVGLGLGARRAGLPVPGRPRLQPSWFLAGLALIGLPLWATFAASTAQVPPGAPAEYLTIAFDHWAVQAASGIAVLLASVLAAFVVEVRGMAVWASALSAAVIGVIMALSQELPVATESPVWCIGAVLWGVLMALALHAAPFTGFAPAVAPAGDAAVSAAGPSEASSD